MSSIGNRSSFVSRYLRTLWERKGHACRHVPHLATPLRVARQLPMEVPLTKTSKYHFSGWTSSGLKDRIDEIQRLLEAGETFDGEPLTPSVRKHMKEEQQAAESELRSRDHIKAA